MPLFHIIEDVLNVIQFLKLFDHVVEAFQSVGVQGYIVRRYPFDVSRKEGKALFFISLRTSEHENDKWDKIGWEGWSVNRRDRDSDMREENEKIWPSWPLLLANAGGKWEEHPDGIGYIYQWWPGVSGNNPGLIVAAAEKDKAAFFKTIDDYSKEQLERVAKDKQRVNLGDMTKEEFHQKALQIHDETKAEIWARALKWAEGL